MQAVILAAGKSSRLYPLANGMHKSMISLLGKPILEHTIERMKRVGIKNLVIVVSKDSAINSYFGNGEKNGVSITYVVQPEPLGMGDALLRSEKNLEDEFLLLHGHHVDVDKFFKELKNRFKEDTKVLLLAKRRIDTWTQGVLKIKNDRLEEIVEKPEKGKEPSNLCAVGVYLISRSFLDVLRNTPSEHYQFEKAVSQFAKGNKVDYLETKQETVTLKYPWDLLGFKNYLLKNIKRSIGKNTSIAKSAEIIGNVVMEDGVKILEGARVKGPCYIGKNVYIGTNSILRNGVDVEENSVIGAHMEVKNSLIYKNVTTHSGYIGDSVIGEGCKIAAHFCTANVRLDRGLVKVLINNQKQETGLKSLGAFLGASVNVGIKASTMPGIVIGSNSIIGPSTMVIRNVAEGSRYFTKFQEVVEEKQ